MDDLDVLVRDFGFGPRGKSNPMRSGNNSDLRSGEDPFNDVFGGPPKYSASSNSMNSSSNKQMNDFDYDSIFKSSEPKGNLNTNNSSSSSSSSKPTFSSLPVYDKPVYDEDIFDGLPGVKNKSPTASVSFEDNVFASMSSPPKTNSRDQQNEFDDLLGTFGRSDKSGDNYRSSSAKSSSSAKEFNDLLPGFGSATSAPTNRPKPESTWGSVPPPGSKHGNSLDDPFVVLDSSSTPGSSSSGVVADPLDEIGKLGKSSSGRAEVSSRSGAAFDDMDAHSNFVKPSNPFSPGGDNRGKNGSPLRSTSYQSDTREQKSNSFRYSESNTQRKVPVDNSEEPPFFDMPNVATDFQKSFGQAAPQYYETSPHIDTPTSEEPEQQFDDIWLTVSEIPLFTQPTAAPHPSRPPPVLPRQSSKSETSSFSSSSRKKGDGFFSPTYGHHSQSPKMARPTAKSPPVSQYDELDDFATGRSQTTVDGRGNFHSSEETNAFSSAAASAAAMKDAMDKAEAKFRHAKEVREREYAKSTRNKESVPLDRDEHDGDDIEFRETQERLERERKQREEEEREQRRLERERERERSRELEREKARQAVERATREARERASAEARERASAEARLRSERAAVEKANAEARVRAERAAVQRAQSEARERAAADAKERAEKAAAEARERTAAEAREKDMRDKAAVARAEAEARRRADRAAVDRAAAEARDRAAAEARERAAAAANAKMNQQKNDDDLESFFNMGRASSAPRQRDNTTDPFFNQPFQNKVPTEAPKRAPSSTASSSNIKKAHSTTNIVDDLSKLFGGPPAAGEFQEVEGETEERRRARMDRHQRTQERAAKALAEKNQRDLQAQRDQDERHRIGDSLDTEIKRWAAGKEGNLRALLSTLQYVLWPECGWQPVSLTDLIVGASVKKAYRKATLCIHPDKVQQKGATLQQKYIAEKVFDLLKEAWNKFNSEELF